MGAVLGAVIRLVGGLVNVGLSVLDALPVPRREPECLGLRSNDEVDRMEGIRVEDVDWAGGTLTVGFDGIDRMEESDG